MRASPVIRPLAAFTVAVLTVAAAHPAQHAPRNAPATRAGVRAQIVSGNGQHARAYVATGASKYVADFAHVLIVRVRGPQPKKGDRIVVFRCLTKGCAFLSADQPDDGKHVDRVGPMYKATVVNGRASLHVTLQGDSPATSYTVEARPSVHDGERALPAVFTLVMR